MPSTFRAVSLAMATILIATYIQSAAGQTSPKPHTAVAVTTSDGRTIAGILSPHSSDEEWILVNQTGSLTATTAIRRRDIVEVRPSNPLIAESNSDSDKTEHAASRMVSYQTPTPVAPANRSARPDWIEATARVSNFDNDGHPDGLEIRIVGLSKTAGTVPLSGSVDARLYGLRQRRVDTRPQIEQLDRWTQTIRSSNRQGDEIVLRVRFRGHPGCDWNLFDWTRLEVRVNTPGQGAWDAATTVQIRPYDPFEEQLQLQRHRWSLGR